MRSRRTLLCVTSTVLHALELAAEALPVRYRTEDLGAEQTVALGLERAVVDRLRLGDLTVGPRPDLLGTGQADANRIEIVDRLGFVEEKRWPAHKNSPS
jgi:hypothetical protein